MTTKSKFDKIFTETVKEIPFNPAWSSGDGFYDRAVASGESFGMTFGETRKSVTAAGKRLLFHYTPLGMLVVFERYMAAEAIKTGKFAVAYSTTAALRESGFIIDPTALFDTDLEYIFGDMPLGGRILQVYKNCKSAVRKHQEDQQKK